MVHAISVAIQLSAAGMTAPFAYRTGKVITRSLLGRIRTGKSFASLMRGAPKFRQLREKTI